MECPHCLAHVVTQFKQSGIGVNQYKGTGWVAYFGVCPNVDCHESIVELQCINVTNTGEPANANQARSRVRHLAYPQHRNRRAFPPEVPADLLGDLAEAVAVLPYSPQASAALSRRILQHLPRDHAGATQHDLAKQIDHMLGSRTLPSHIAEDLDAIRNHGNFAAHPLKSTSSGLILPVEAGEAEWSLHVIEGLFDFYFVEPAKAKVRRDALNAKLQEAGKPQMKAPPP